MRVLRGLLIAVAVVLLLVVVAVAVLLSAPARDTLRSGFASWVSAELGRPLRIDGDLSVQLGRHIGVTASNVSLANVSWGSRANMLTAAQIAIEVDAMSLLARAPTLVVSEIRVDGLNLLLERNADGDANWQFGAAPKESGPSWLAAFPVVIERVALPGAQVEFKGPRLDRPLEVRFEEFDQRLGEGDVLDVTGTGHVNELDLRLSGQIGPLANLIAAKGFSASFEAQIGELNLSANARIDDLARPVDSEVHVELHGPNADYVASTLGVRNLGDGPFDLSLSVSQSPDGNGVRGSVVGKIGEFDISGDGELSEPSEAGKLTIRTEVTGPDVSLLAGIVGFDVLPAERFHLVATVRRAGELLQIDQAELQLLDSDLSVKGSIRRVNTFAGDDLTIHVAGASVEKFRKLLHVPGVATGPFDVTGTLRSSSAGEDNLDLTARTELVNLTATGPLGAYPDYYGTRLKVSVGGPNFAPFGSQLGLRFDGRSPFTGHGEFEWGATGVVLHAAELTVGDDILNLEGLVGRPPEFDASLRFGVGGKNLATLVGLAGWTGFPAQAYRAAGQLDRRNGRLRLEAVDIAAAGAQLQLSGSVAATSSEDTALTFLFEGRDLRPFGTLTPDVALPSGAFRAQGSATVNNRRAVLRNVSVSAAGSQGVVSADIALPLGTTSIAAPNRIEVHASGPDLKALVPGVPESAGVRQKFDLRANASWDAGSWTFDTLRLDTPGGSLDVRGKLDRAPDYSATQMRVAVHTLDLHGMGLWFGLELPERPLDVTATISGSPTAFRADPFSGRLGESDCAGTVSLDLKAKPTIGLLLHCSFLDLTPLTDAIAGAGETSSPVVRRDDRNIPAIALPIAMLNRFDGTATIDAAATSFFDQRYEHLVARGQLRDGSLTIDPLQFGGDVGNLTLRLAIGPVSAAPNVRLSMLGNGVQLGVIPGMNRTAAASSYDVKADVAGSGLNLRDLVATLDGSISLVGAGGRIPNSRMNAFASDFMSQLLSTLNPFSKREEYTDVVCQAYLFDASNGVLRTSPAMVVRTTRIDVVSNGSVDLRTEAIDFNFKTGARGGLGFSAGALLNSYVKVSGTLSRPHLTVDPTGTLVNGGAAFATGGLSILATTLWDRLSRQKDPCASARAEADKRAASHKRWW